jgi:hypothetical protein
MDRRKLLLGAAAFSVTAPASAWARAKITAADVQQVESSQASALILSYYAFEGFNNASLIIGNVDTQERWRRRTESARTRLACTSSNRDGIAYLRQPSGQTHQGVCR